MKRTSPALTCVLLLLAAGCQSEESSNTGAKAGGGEKPSVGTRKPLHPNASLVLYRPDNTVAETFANIVSSTEAKPANFTMTALNSGFANVAVDNKPLYKIDWHWHSTDGEKIDEYTFEIVKPGNAEPIPVPAFLTDKPVQLYELDGYKLKLEPNPPGKP